MTQIIKTQLQRDILRKSLVAMIAPTSRIQKATLDDTLLDKLCEMVKGRCPGRDWDNRPIQAHELRRIRIGKTKEDGGVAGAAWQRRNQEQRLERQRELARARVSTFRK